jgi:cytochrome c oxidase cbb3-type subunit 4
MDLNTLRVAVTVVSFVTFIGIFLWAYSNGPRKGFAEAAQLPFLDDAAKRPSPGDAVKRPFPGDDGHQGGGTEARR